MRSPGGTLLLGLGAQGRTLVSWSLAGGLLVTVLFSWTDRGVHGSGGLDLPVVILVYALGAVLGLSHGAALAYYGRPHGVGEHLCLKGLARCVVIVSMSLFAGGIVAVWQFLMPVPSELGPLSVRGMVAASWLVTVSVVIWALVEGLRSLTAAYGRWPGGRTGLFVLATTFAVILATLPEHGFGPFADLKGLWIVVMAGLITLWIALPLVTVAALAFGHGPNR